MKLPQTVSCSLAPTTDQIEVVDVDSDGHTLISVRTTRFGDEIETDFFLTAESVRILRKALKAAERIAAEVLS